MHHSPMIPSEMAFEKFVAAIETDSEISPKVLDAVVSDLAQGSTGLASLEAALRDLGNDSSVEG